MFVSHRNLCKLPLVFNWHLFGCFWCEKRKITKYSTLNNVHYYIHTMELFALSLYAIVGVHMVYKVSRYVVKHYK